MFIPARKAHGPAKTCTRLPRLLTVATTGAVFVGAGFGVAPASADRQQGRELAVSVDIVGDSYMAGDGLRDTYLDPADPRHRSSAAPALQALARVRSDNPLLKVDANLVAASGARTADFFHAQAGQDNVLVNAPQRDQIRPDAQLVIVGFGGDDARLATVLAAARRTSGGPNTALDKQIRELAPLLDWSASDEEYIAQAKASLPGQAPTLVARLLQVLAGISARAPQAKIMITTYPLAADPQSAHAASLVGEDELTSVRKFGYDLNKAIDRAVRICACGSLTDLSEAISGHEIYTTDSAYDESPDQQAPQGEFQPNDKGASLIADPIADGIADVLEITAPKPGGGRRTVPENIEVRGGVPDRDGDRVADTEDRAPDDPTRSTDTREPDTRHGADEGTSSHHGSKSNQAHGSRPPRNGVLQPIIQVVTGLAPGQSPIGQYDRPAGPAGDNHPGTVESRPPAREQTAPLTPTAQATEPAAAGPVPGEDGAHASRVWSEAMQDVILKAEPAGYVSQYSAKALRVTTTPADERAVLDKNAVDGQMSQSFLDEDTRAGFRTRFGEDIDAIHNAATVREQDAAIARFDQTAGEYNATELSARDAYGAHPVDARGETVRVTPHALGDLAAETTTYGPVDLSSPAAAGDQEPTRAVTVTDLAGETMLSAQADAGTVAGEPATYGPVDAGTLAAVGDQAPARGFTVADVAGQTTTSGQVDAGTLAAAGGPKSGQSKSSKPNVSVDAAKPSFSESISVGPAAEGEVSRSAERDGVAISGTAEGKVLGGEASISGSVGPEGVNGKVGVSGYLGEGTVGVKGRSGGAEVGYEGRAAAGAELGAHAKVNGPKDFDAGVQGKIGAEVSLGDSAKYGLAEASRKAEVGVGAEADTHSKVGPDGFDVGSKAFAGAKAGAEAEVGIPGLTIGFRATGWAGPGYEIGAKYGKTDDGSFKTGVNAGFSPVFGGAVGLNISVNPDKLQQSVKEAVESLNPFGPAAQAPPADFDAEYSGPTPGTTGENDDPGAVAAAAVAPADNDAQYSGPTPGTTGENDDPGSAPAIDEAAPAAAATDNDEDYSGPTPGTTGENDDPGYSAEPAIDLSANPDATTNGNTDPASDTIAGYAGDDTLTSNPGDDTLGGQTDTSGSDSGASDSGYSEGGYSDAGLGDTSDGEGAGDATGGLGDGSDGGIGGGDTSGMGDSGMGGDTGDSGAVGGDSGDSGGVGGDSGGMGGDSSGGDGSGSGMGSGGMGGTSGDGGGGDGGSSSGGDGGGSSGGGGGGGF
jgi:hypothetical protein